MVTTMHASVIAATVTTIVNLPAAQPSTSNSAHLQPTVIVAAAPCVKSVSSLPLPLPPPVPPLIVDTCQKMTRNVAYEGRVREHVETKTHHHHHNHRKPHHYL
ncbi:hypothetical protein BGZ89_002700 [Linnemannia elongata]|nr:hypothetical protein BGZ89_002700 [Linnemannia elongata]